MTDLRIFIGYDAREAVAYHVLAHSILSRASAPYSITPLALPQLGRAYTRGPGGSTAFTFTRFLVPYLSNYEGLSLFLDCDILVQADITEVLLHPLLDPGRAVYVCQHDYVPRQSVKFLGAPQQAYPRKNWSSVMLFDNARCKALTPAYVNTASPADLHRFAWLSDAQIGSLPLEWNYLVGEDNQSPEPPKAIHYTNGGPYFPEYAGCDFADAWFAERDAMLSVAVPEAVA